MKELVILEIPHGEDRSDLTAILAAAGYPCVQRVDNGEYFWEKKYLVVVYEKPERKEGQ